VWRARQYAALPRASSRFWVNTCMKTLVACVLVVLLPGCALYDAYMQTGFDNNEYLLITQIRVDAHTYRPQCANHLLAAANAQAMAAKTELFERYSERIPRNDQGRRASRSLNQIAQGLASSYIDANQQPSAVFCRLKYTSIENSAVVIQTVVGDRPR
jgi:hypothetical protein